MSPQRSEECRLICQARAGDAECLATLTQLVQQRVCGYIHRATLNPDTAQDLTQDTLLSILSSLDKLERVDRFWPWVFRIATNRICQYYRDSARCRTVQMPDERACPSAAREASSDPVADAAKGEMATLTWLALSGVSERHRVVLLLRFFKGLPYSEIARFLKCSELTTRAVLCRAKNALAGEFAQLWSELVNARDSRQIRVQPRF